jgi:hypothetical protein
MSLVEDVFAVHGESRKEDVRGLILYDLRADSLLVKLDVIH